MVFRDSAEGTAKVSTTRAVEARHTHTAHNRVCLSIFAPPNHRMQPALQPVIEFACANLPPVWRAADARC